MGTWSSSSAAPTSSSKSLSAAVGFLTGCADEEGIGDGQREKTPSSSVQANRFSVGENASLTIVALEEHVYLEK